MSDDMSALDAFGIQDSSQSTQGCIETDPQRIGRRNYAKFTFKLLNPAEARFAGGHPASENQDRFIAPSRRDVFPDNPVYSQAFIRVGGSERLKVSPLFRGDITVYCIQ